MTKITVVAQADRRRAGRRFPARQGVIIDVADLDDDQKRALDNDTLLKIHEGELEDAISDTLPRALKPGEPAVAGKGSGKPAKPVVPPKDKRSRKGSSAAARKANATKNAEEREAGRRMDALSAAVKKLGKDGENEDGTPNAAKLQEAVEFEPTAEELEALSKI